LPFCHVQLVGPKPLPRAYPRELRTLGDHLRKQRIDLGLLQRDVAEKLQVNQMTICNWETNRTSPQLRLIPEIVAFLGYDPHDTPPQALGKRIIAIRRSLGLSQKRLARLLNIDPSTLGRWETGEGSPSKILLRRLDAFLTSHLKDQQ
jgi:transcriptional regulator with XRE-family HTH domain